MVNRHWLTNYRSRHNGRTPEIHQITSWGRRLSVVLFPLSCRRVFVKMPNCEDHSSSLTTIFNIITPEATYQFVTVSVFVWQTSKHTRVQTVGWINMSYVLGKQIVFLKIFIRAFSGNERSRHHRSSHPSRAAPASSGDIRALSTSVNSIIRFGGRVKNCLHICFDFSFRLPKGRNGPDLW